MTSQRQFYKTTVTYVILSEEPVGDPTLEQIHKACHEDGGEWVGHCTGMVEEILTAVQAVDALCEAGSEPAFFQLDEHGNDDSW